MRSNVCDKCRAIFPRLAATIPLCPDCQWLTDLKGSFEPAQRAEVIKHCQNIRKLVIVLPGEFVPLETQAATV